MLMKPRSIVSSMSRSSFINFVDRHLAVKQQQPLTGEELSGHSGQSTKGFSFSCSDKRGEQENLKEGPQSPDTPINDHNCVTGQSKFLAGLNKVCEVDPIFNVANIPSGCFDFSIKGTPIESGWQRLLLLHKMQDMPGREEVYKTQFSSTLFPSKD